jgi:VWFA-related protein
MFAKIHRLLIGLIILPGLLLSSNQSLGKHYEDDIKIDIPPDGRVRVDNRFGDVTAEVWEQRYVSVSAAISGSSSASQNRSPIVIDNRNGFLSVSTSRIPVNSATVIDLTIKVPASANLEVSTAKGKITVRGLSASARLKSVAGDISATLDEPLDVNLTARAVRGVITSGFAEKPGSDDHLWQVRLGEGSQRRTIDAETETGRIAVAPMAAKQVSNVKPSGSPELQGSKTSTKPSGTPESPNESAELDEGDIIRVDSQLVTLNMSVVDRSTRRGLQGLLRDDFKLFEDGEEQNIVQFDSSNAPFDLVLVMDLSGSTKDVVKLIREAALHFVDAARPSDRIAVITFAADAKVVSPLTADRELLRQRINTIDTDRGDTRLYDATVFAMNEIGRDAKRSRRSAIILMSDGLDGTIPGVSGQYGSQMSYQEALRTIQEFDGVLYTLCLDTFYVAMNPRDTQPEAFDLAYDRMKEMADAGGGTFYEVKRLTDLAGAYEQVVADLGTVYSLAYKPSNKTRDGKWRAIKISVNRSNAVARGKRGYYAN